MLMDLTNDTASGNQLLAGLPREKYPNPVSNPRPVSPAPNKALTFSKHVMFLSVMSHNDRCSEFSFGTSRRDCPTYH